MSYNAVPTVATGDLWSAANHNTYIRDNFAAGVPDIFSAAGQLVYGAGVDSASVLALGAAGKVLKVNSGATAPEWGDVAGITARQGGDANNYDTPGTTNYSSPSIEMQTGVVNVVINSGWSYNHTPVTVTFPHAFGDVPEVVAVGTNMSGTVGAYSLTGDTRNATASTVEITMTLGALASGNQTIRVRWIAVGKPPAA